MKVFAFKQVDLFLSNFFAPLCFQTNFSKCSNIFLLMIISDSSEKNFFDASSNYVSSVCVTCYVTQLRKYKFDIYADLFTMYHSLCYILHILILFIIPKWSGGYFTNVIYWFIRVILQGGKLPQTMKLRLFIWLSGSSVDRLLQI